MTPETYDIWNTLRNVSISNNGDWVTYTIAPGKGDQTLYLYNTRIGSTKTFERGHSAVFDYDNSFFAFRRKASYDTLQSLKRLKKKKDAFPKDTLIIYSLNSEIEESIPEIQDFKVPEEAGGLIAVRLADRGP